MSPNTYGLSWKIFVMLRLGSLGHQEKGIKSKCSAVHVLREHMHVECLEP